jgi:hypothetical protein
MSPNSASDKTYSRAEGIVLRANHTQPCSCVECGVLHGANLRHDGAESQGDNRTLSPTVTTEPAPTAKPCGCVGACTATCRNDRSALRRASKLRRNGPVAPLAVSPRVQRKGLKPSALKVLGRLLAGPATNRELLNLAGFGWACRVSEVRRYAAVQGGDVRCEALGPTPGIRTYTLEIPAREAGGLEVADGKPLPVPDVLGDAPPGADVLDSDMEAS